MDTKEKLRQFDKEAEKNKEFYFCAILDSRTEQRIVCGKNQIWNRESNSPIEPYCLWD